MPLSPRQQLLLDKCATPQTVPDLSETLGVGYHTIRRELLALEELQLIQEQPWRDGTAKVYQTIFSIKDGKIERFQFSLQGKPASILDILRHIDDNSSNVSKQIRVITLAALKPLWEMHVAQDTDEFSVDVVPSSTVVKAKLIAYGQQMQGWANLCDQLINAPIWDGGDFPKMLVGQTEVDWDVIKQFIDELMHLAIDNDWPLKA